MGLDKTVGPSLQTAASPAPPRRVHRAMSAREGGLAGPPHSAWCGRADQIAIDIPNASIALLVSEEELAARKAAYVQPAPNITTGWLSRYARMVTSADEGAVLR